MNQIARPLPAGLPNGLADELRAIVGAKGWSEDPEILAPQLKDWTGYYTGTTPLMVMPATTAEVAAVVRACAEAGVGIVPQSGNTGLVGAQLPHGQVLLSLKRMNKVRGIDALDYTMTAEAGCILADLQQAALDAQRFFPLSLGAEGSCMIGGNLSTNAGGINVLRYGNTRELVLGLEVVMPDGRVWDGLRRLRKDNTGYALKHLFVGAEGTLGIITAATLRLFPLPIEQATAFAAIRDLDAAVELLSILRAGSGDAISSYELIPRMGIELGLEYGTGMADPLARKHDWHVLIEFTGTIADGTARAKLEAALGEALEKGVVVDATIAASTEQSLKLWRIREAMVEYQYRAGASIKHDISVPVSRVPEFIRRANAALAAMVPGIRPLAFGHVGDGNVHYNLTQPGGMAREAYLALGEDIHRAVYETVAALDGSFSAEHGVGAVKREELKRYRPPIEVELMRRLKQALDPQGLMNPGKVL
ncbi:MAG: FAD-binding oxidoreductase [Alphaproteobacteria bacterium]|nr:FAD-binding oxidoreductase [Alphaproteobacteria bacterium]